MSNPGAPVRIDVWSDYVCPFCYLELPVLEQLQQEFGPALEVHWRAYELRPAPVPTLEPGGEYLRTTWARAVYPMAEQRGMTLKLPPVQPRSRLALEAAEFAKDAGAFPAFSPAQTEVASSAVQAAPDRARNVFMFLDSRPPSSRHTRGGAFAFGPGR